MVLASLAVILHGILLLPQSRLESPTLKDTLFFYPGGPYKPGQRTPSST